MLMIIGYHMLMVIAIIFSSTIYYVKVCYMALQYLDYTICYVIIWYIMKDIDNMIIWTINYMV